MTTLIDRPAVDTESRAVPGQPRLVPVQHRGRPVGAYVIGVDRVSFQPAVDVTRLAAIGLTAVTLTATITALASRRRQPPAIGAVTMGPGG